jgi:hypothetical protein
MISKCNKDVRSIKDWPLGEEIWYGSAEAVVRNKAVPATKVSDKLTVWLSMERNR